MKTMLEVLDGWIEQRLDAIHTILPAKVINVDGHFVDVVPCIKLRAIGSYIEPPTIYRVPFMQGGSKTSGIEQKIEIDDLGVLLVAENDISMWKENGSMEVNDQPRFDLSNSIFLRGAYPDSEQFHTTKLGKAIIALWAEGKGQIAIYNGESSLRAELDKIYDLMSKFFQSFLDMMQQAIPQAPMMGGSFSALFAQLTAQKQEWEQNKADVDKIFIEGG